jgi:hypothetical protein
MTRALLLLCLIACGDNLPDPGTPHSGQRLKLGWWQFDDGPRQRETSWYYDAALGERCQPSDWSDGQRYCAPTTDEAVYVSDTCSRALGRTAIGADPAPFFATTFYLGGKPLRSRVFQRGEDTAAPISLWQKHADGCIGPFEPGDGYAYFDLGREVQSLVRLRHSEPRGEGELAIVDEASDDGLRVPIAYYDRTLDVECTPAEHANVEGAECVPNDAALVSYFHEVGCQDPELAIALGDTVPATAKHYSQRTRCWHYYDIGDEVEAPPLYEDLGGTCVSVSPPGGSRFFTTAGPHQTQGVMRQRVATSDRLLQIDRVRVQGDQELRIADPLLFDRKLETDCRRDGDARCVPVTEAKVEPFFWDSICSMPLELARVPSGNCDPPTKFARRGDELVPLDIHWTGAIYWLSTGDTCALYGPPEPFTMWTVGPAIDPATFARAQLEIDP